MAQKTDVIIEAITPLPASVTSRELHYRNFRAALNQAGFMAALKKSGEVLVGKRDIPSIDTIRHDFYAAYLLNASHRLQHARTPLEKLFWSQQFSVGSIQLFGQPQPKLIAPLAAEERDYFKWMNSSIEANDEFVLPLIKTYSKLAGRAKASSATEQKYRQTLSRIKEYYHSEYDELFACFDEYDSVGRLNPEQLYECFSKAVDLLRKKDPVWQKWKVVKTKKANLSVNVRKSWICIGQQRVPVSTREVRGLFAHEVLVHALRAVNGRKLDKKLRFGLPDYLVAEEGLGVLVESAINDEVAPKAKDRYIDIALALGGYRQRALNREELFDIAYIRAVLRSLTGLNGEESLDHIERSTWQHVNRIYRGTRGDKYIGVFTKDIAYYEGLVSMAQYIDRRLKKSSIESVMGYVLCGKFDPTNKQHRKQVKLLTK